MIVDTKEAKNKGLTILKDLSTSISVGELAEMTGKSKNQIHNGIREHILNAGVLEGVNGRRIIKDKKYDAYLAANPKKEAVQQ